MAAAAAPSLARLFGSIDSVMVRNTADGTQAGGGMRGDQLGQGVQWNGASDKLTTESGQVCDLDDAAAKIGLLDDKSRDAERHAIVRRSDGAFWVIDRGRRSKDAPLASGICFCRGKSAGDRKQDQVFRFHERHPLHLHRPVDARSQG